MRLRSQAMFASPVPEDTQGPNTSVNRKLMLTEGKAEPLDEVCTPMLLDEDGENKEHEDNDDADDDKDESDSDEADDDDENDDDSEYERTDQQNHGHDPNQEPLPLHPAFDQAIPAIKSRLLSSVKQLLSTLELHSSASKELRAMLERGTENVQEIEVPKKKFGFVGDTGMGKSATINSITGIAELAKADASGQSCTHVATLYKHKLDFQDPETTAFAAEIRYLDIGRCETFLSEQLDNYNKFTFQREDDWEAEQLQEYELLRDQALAMFQSLFCNQEEFESPRAAEEFLQGNYEDSNRPALSTFVAWCENRFEQLDTIDGMPILQFSAGTMVELNEFLEPQVYQKANVNEPVLCPLIEHVCIGAATSDILRYMDLADLPGMVEAVLHESQVLKVNPGISDTNSVRASIAHNYVKHCDGLLIFDQVKRCLTNPALDKILGTYGEQFQEQLIVVVTHTDDTGGSDNVIAKTIKGEGQSVGEYFVLASAIRKLERKIRSITTRLSKWKAKSRTGNQAKRLAAFNEMKIQRTEKILELDILKNQQFEALVDARNSNIVRKMQKDKSKYIPAEAILNVQCISNLHYQSLCRGSTIGGLQLDAANTGVPMLRAKLLELTAPSKLRAAEDLIGNATIFVRGVQLWVKDTPIKNCSGILEVVKAPAKVWSVDVQQYLQRVAIMFGVEIIQPLRDARLQSLQGAHEWILKGLLKWHPSSVLAFFDKNGNHKTKSVGPQIWNERLLEVQTKEILQPRWTAMMSKQKELLTSAVESTVAQLKAIPYKLNQDPNALPISQFLVKDLVKTHTLSIYRALQTRMETHEAVVRAIKTDATKDIPSAYFTIAMKPTYNCCHTHTGKGKMKRKLAVLDSDLQKEKLTAFDKMATCLEKNLVEQSIVAARDLQSDVQKLLDGMKEQFEMFLLKQSETAQRRLARRELASILDQVLPAIDGANAEMEAVKTKYKQGQCCVRFR